MIFNRRILPLLAAGLLSGLACLAALLPRIAEKCCGAENRITNRAERATAPCPMGGAQPSAPETPGPQRGCCAVLPAAVLNQARLRDGMVFPLPAVRPVSRPAAGRRDGLRRVALPARHRQTAAFNLPLRI